VNPAITGDLGARARPAHQHGHGLAAPSPELDVPPPPRIAAGRAAEQLIIRALAEHGVLGPRAGRMKPAAMTWFSSAPAA